MTIYDFLHFVLELKLISGDWMQILPDGISELLNTYKKNPHIYNMMMDTLGAVSIRKTVLPGMAIPMLKIRRPNGRLIFNMGIPIPGKDGLYIETGPWKSWGFMVKYQDIIHSLRFYCVSIISDIAYCIFSSMTKHIRVALREKNTFFLVGAKPIPTNRNVKHMFSHRQFWYIP